MIRPFHLRDVALVHRLSEHGVSLHTESALTRHINPIKGALFGIVGGDYPTFVWKSEDRSGAGFIQLNMNEDSQLANILFLSSTHDENQVETEETEQQNDANEVPHSAENGKLNDQAWLSLLDQSVVEVGRRGIHSLVAEVNELGPELPILRQAGFAVYTRQDIWHMNESQSSSVAPLDILTTRHTDDDWDIHLLYANTVPRLVQMVEPMPPIDEGAGWVLREAGDLAAFIHVMDGATATWIRLFVHPNAEARVEEIMTAVLQLHPPKLTHPVYCCVRRYQSWVQQALARTGFSLWGSQAVMVKHTVQHARKPVSDLSVLLDSQPITPTTPIIHQIRPRHHKDKNGKQGTAI